MFTIGKSATARSASRTLRIACAVLAAASVTFATTGAYADDSAPQKTVKFQDLDLSKQQAAQELYGRLKRAARSVCRTLDGRSLKEQYQYSQCYDTALSTAVERVGNGALTAVHAGSGAVRVAKSRTEGEPRS